MFSLVWMQGLISQDLDVQGFPGIGFVFMGTDCVQQVVFMDKDGSGLDLGSLCFQ